MNDLWIKLIREKRKQKKRKKKKGETNEDGHDKIHYLSAKRKEGENKPKKG